MSRYYYIVHRADGTPWYREASEEPLAEDSIRRAVTEEEYNAFDAEKNARICALKEQLAATDYIACKIAEGAATAEEYAEQIAQRAVWRAEINRLRGEGVA